MRRTIFTNVGAAAGLALGFAAASPSNAEELVLATWGGTWGQGIQEQVIDPFEAETGIKVNVISGVSAANMQVVRSQRDNPRVDVITMVTQDGVGAYDDGLLAPLHAEEIPNLEGLSEIGVRRDADGHPMFAGIWMYPFGLIHRTDVMDWEINSWMDLWDPRLRNKVAASSPRYMSNYFLLMVNKVAGGDEWNLDPGFQKVAELQPNLIAVADDSATQQRLLAQGEVWAMPMISGAANRLIEQGVPGRFVIPEEGAPVGVDIIALVNNGPNPEAAKKFIDFWLRADRAAAAASAVGVLPIPAESGEPYTGPYALTEDEIDRLVVFDDQAMIDNREAWMDRWDRELAPLIAR